MVEKNICDPQQTVHYQRISGRLQRIEGISVKKKVEKHNFVYIFYPYCIGSLVVILLCIFIACSIFPYPLHASCTVKWIFKEPCNHVIQRLRWQILKRSYHDCELNGGRCLYSLEESDKNTITATRITSSYKISNNIRILFTEGTDKNCTATAKSESNEWFSLFDYGENYCNLRKLVNGANFVTDHGFNEITTNSICTQVNMVVCKLL